jgi:DUF4097 and DUF4098 domain-containing protein YvlB
MKTFNFITGLFMLFISIQSVYAETLEETFKRSVSAEGKKALELNNANGSVQITGWDKNEIDIIAYKRVSSSDMDYAQNCMDDLEIEITETKDKLIIDTHYPRHKKSSGFISWMFNIPGYNCSVEYEIKAPYKFNLDITSTNGSIDASEFEGVSRLKTTNGKIVAERMQGALDLISTNGSIKAELDEVLDAKAMEIRTTNGSIKLWLPGNINADLEAHTTNGSIDCDLPLSEKYRKSRRALDATINDGGALIYLKTTNGSIHIYEI